MINMPLESYFFDSTDKFLSTERALACSTPYIYALSVEDKYVAVHTRKSFAEFIETQSVVGSHEHMGTLIGFSQ